MAMAVKLHVAVIQFPLNSYIKNRRVYITDLVAIEGREDNVKKYVNHLRKMNKNSEQISTNLVFNLAEMRSNLDYYTSFYSPTLIYPRPILHKEGIEYIEIASWDRSVLSNILTHIRNNKNTKLLKIMSFKREPLKDIFIMRALPRLTEKQREIFTFAITNGYYHFPRKVNLDDLSKMMKMSKSNLHEILRRAESNILSYFI